MGDGQHVWAAAEWVMMMRNLFLREEGRVLVIGSGIPDEWQRSGRTLAFGPGPTAFGPVRVSITPNPQGWRVAWEAAWRVPPSCVVVRLPGRKTVSVTDPGTSGVDVPAAAERVPEAAGPVPA
jgi:hypothetical protein